MTSTSFTHISVDQLDDLAAQYGMGDRGESRFGEGRLGATQTGVAFHRLRAGKRQAFGHVHEQAEEIFYVTAGAGRVMLDDELVEMRAGDVLRVAPEVRRRFEAGEDGMEFVAFGPRFDGDGEMLPDFWAE